MADRTELGTATTQQAWAKTGAEIVRQPAEEIIGTLAEDPSTVEYLRALADEYDALLRYARPVDIEAARRRHGE